MTVITRADAKFLGTPRLAILTTSSFPGAWPLPVPVWFEWADGTARMFSGAAAPKVRRLQADPHATLLATNHVGESEHWVALDGTVEITSDGVIELVERLTPRYWDLGVAEHADTLAGWREAADTMVQLILTPQRVRRG